MTTEQTTTEKAPVKLTKAQKEFFGAFARNAVENILVPILEFRGIELSEEQASGLMATIDLKDLTQAIGEGFLELVPFKDIVKVDRFMKSDEFTRVIAASTEVNAAVQAELVQIIAPLIPQDAPAEVVEAQ